MINTPAPSPENISALRAKVFSDGADEIAKIDSVNRTSIKRGAIGVVLDAIHGKLGKSQSEFRRKTNERDISLLQEAFQDAFGIRIKNASHLYDMIKTRVGKEGDIYGKKAHERALIEQFVRNIGTKLLNGHAGVWI